jgi:hypothetical protein
LKKGGGVGRKGGFGYLHDPHRFAEPFSEALDRVMKSHALPAGDTVDSRLTLDIIADLKGKWAQHVQPVYIRHGEVTSEERPTWNSVSDLVRRYAYGTHEGAVLPPYILKTIEKIEDPRWKFFFFTRLIIKHNHGVVEYQTRKGQKGCRAALMDLQGAVVPPDADGRPPKPQEKHFFNIVSLDPNAQLPGQEHDPAPVPAPAPAAGAAPAVGAAAAAGAAASGSDGESDSSVEGVLDRFKTVKKVKMNVPPPPEAAGGQGSGRKSPSSAPSNAATRPLSTRQGPVAKRTAHKVPRKGPGVGKDGAKRKPAAGKHRSI